MNFLYKYFPLRESHAGDFAHIKDVIEKNELYFSRLKDFNDPYDCCPIFDAPDNDFNDWHMHLEDSNSCTNAQLMTVQHAWQARSRPSIQIVQEVKSKMESHINEELGICCFSKKPDNLLMWAHYASSHAGVCFEFAYTRSTQFFGEAMEVKYASDRPTINIFKHHSDPVAVDTAFLTKSLDWEHESEHRIVGPNRAPGETHKFPRECLKGIILGARIEQKNEIILKGILKNKGFISVKKARLNNKLYKIDIEVLPNN